MCSESQDMYDLSGVKVKFSLGVREVQGSNLGQVSKIYFEKILYFVTLMLLMKVTNYF